MYALSGDSTGVPLGIIASNGIAKPYYRNMFRISAMLPMAIVLAGGLARGAVIVSTFSDTPPGYRTGAGFGLSASLVGPPPFGFVNKNYWAMGFVPTTAAVADRVSVPLQFTSGEVRVSLADSLNGSPGTILDSIVLSGPLGSTYDVYSGNFAAAPELAAGQLYWLIASIDGSTGSASWALSGTGTGLIGNRNDFQPGSPWSVIPNSSMFELAAFRIEGPVGGDTVPEPGTLAITCIGIAALAWRRAVAEQFINQRRATIRSATGAPSIAEEL